MIGSRGIDNQYGGIEKTLTEICPRLVRRGHEVVVFGQDNGRRTKSLYKGVTLIHVAGMSGKHAETLSRSALSTFRSMAKGFDILHFHAQGPGIFSSMARLFGVKSVVTVHGLDWKRAKWSPLARTSLKIAEKVAVKCADEIVVVAKNLQDYFAGAHGVRTQYIPNGLPETVCDSHVDRLESFGLSTNEYVFFANRLEPGKGCQDLIAAFNGIATEKKLVIAGDNRYQSAFIQELKKSADPKKVIFTGHITGELLAQLYRNAYLFILPSYSEGLSNALLEAIGYRKYPLVSDIQGNMEVVEQPEFSFKAGNVSDLQCKLTALLDNEAKVREGEAKIFLEARKKYNWDSVVDQYEKTYSSLAK